MMKDLSIKLTENEVLNIRSAALIKYNGQILVSKRSDKDYYSLPGGRIKFNEDSKEAVIREIKEELNYEIEEGELKLVRTVENLFTYGEKTRFHEYLFIYEINLKDEYYNGDFTNLENPNMKMEWIPEDAIILMNLKPEIAKGIISNNEYKHLIIKEK